MNMDRDEKCLSTNRLIVICGPSFAGKSTLGDAICAEFRFMQVDVDRTKVQLFGESVDFEELTREEWNEIYRETDDKIVNLLRSGTSVVDASRNFRKAERDGARSIAEKVNAETVLIYVDTPEWLARQRRSENRDKQIRTDISDEEFEEIISVIEPPTADETPLIFRCDDDIHDWLERYGGYLLGDRRFDVIEDRLGCGDRGINPLLHGAKNELGFRCRSGFVTRRNVAKTVMPRFVEIENSLRVRLSGDKPPPTRGENSMLGSDVGAAIKILVFERSK